MVYSELIDAVHKKGKALENVPSLPHVNVVGSIGTATHGSGFDKPIIAGYVTAIVLVLADGSVLRLSKADTPDFYLYILNFGSVGIII